ncbi:MAG: hypothetical protein A2901_01835 [Elusimicrobia bacterium RIFCSPLOWO2_01_FULL_54_10]|nr:MAG: hypothetical protein A2901_01835 [Elusimicrobia bacterium RIFCSPLOWO2_01_FULL_54_10]
MKKPTTPPPDSVSEKDSLLQSAADSLFPIVGIGASAGGLEAVTQLLKMVPADTGMSFVIIQHLDPTRVSNLASILARATSMKVDQVKDGMVVEPNHVYVFPPNMNMTLNNNAFQLLPRSEVRAMHMPVDYFFRSMAQLGSHAIGIILSGSGTDGTLGLAQIKEEGGITFAQDELTAKFAGMPHSAVLAGAADFVYSVQDIVQELIKIAHHPYIASAARISEEEEQRPGSQPNESLDALGQILHLLQSEKDVNFNHYKKATILRRISRRMAINKIEKIEDYAKFLQGNPDELKELYHDLLIKVTSFFRDPETFEILKKAVIPKIMEGRSAANLIRLWVAGCATGEEAYSIAIYFLEEFRRQGVEPYMQIFATDIDEDALATARTGIYIENIVADVSEERLKRYFTKIDHNYRINKSIRDICTFAKHDLGIDPPFSNLDLITCRNVMIYFDPVLQKRIIPVFHYALKPKGYLMLGSSESIGSFNSLFNTIDPRSRIFAKNPVKTPAPMNLSPWEPRTGEAKKVYLAKPVSDYLSKETDANKDMDRILLNHYIPAGVLVNDQMDILQFRGDTAHYLQPSSGKMSLNLLRMAREGLLAVSKSAVDEARKTAAPVTRKNISVRFDNRLLNVTLKVIPLNVPPSPEHNFMVVFEESVAARRKGKKGKDAQPDSKHDSSVREYAHLTNELIATKQHMQSIIESQDATNEELKSANEEIFSSNEELQSTNEELQTSQEELQSTNEELLTANDEIRIRITELDKAHNDLSNLLASSNLSIVLIGSDMNLRQFTKVAERALNIDYTHIGRPIGQLKLGIPVPEIESLAASVIASDRVEEREVQDAQGHWFNLQFRPFKTTEGKIAGVLLVFVDIHSIKGVEKLTRSLDELQAARTHSQWIVETVRQPILILDDVFNVVSANPAYYWTFQVTEQETRNRSLYELGNGQWNNPKLKEFLREILPQNSEFNNFQVERDFPGIGRRTMILNARRLGSQKQIFLAVEDVTDRKKIEELLAIERGNLEKVNHELDQFVHVASHDLRAPLRAIGSFSSILQKDLDGKLDPDSKDTLEQIILGAKRMNELIDDLLTLSRITKVTNPFELVNIQDIIEVVERRLHSDIAESSAMITVHQPLPAVNCDRIKITEVFVNLINNAIKYSSKNSGGQAKIEIGARALEGQYEFFVKDNGIGIDSQYHLQIFDMFKRLHSKDQYEGTGAGLYIVKNIIEEHGGKVWVESQVGKGATFRFTIPKNLKVN